MMIDRVDSYIVKLLRIATDLCVLSSGRPPGAQCTAAAGTVSRRSTVARSQSPFSHGLPFPGPIFTTRQTPLP
jgi:hypothetical protein